MRGVLGAIKIAFRARRSQDAKLPGDLVARIG